MLNYFLFSWIFDWMYGWMSEISQFGQYTMAALSLGFLIGLVFIVKKHEKEYK